MKRVVLAIIPAAVLVVGFGCERKTTVVEPSGPVYGDGGPRHDGDWDRRHDDHDDRDDHDDHDRH